MKDGLFLRRAVRLEKAVKAGLDRGEEKVERLGSAARSARLKKRVEEATGAPQSRERGCSAFRRGRIGETIDGFCESGEGDADELRQDQRLSERCHLLHDKVE